MVRSLRPLAPMRSSAALLCCLLALCSCSRGPSTQAEVAAPTPAASPPATPAPAVSAAHTGSNVQIEMKNVRLHVADGIILDIPYLRGVMESRHPGQPPVFDDQQSFVLHLLEGTIAMDAASLQTLLNRHVMGYDGAPLKNVEVRTEGDRLVMKGKLHKGVDVPFSTKASVGVTEDGNLRLHTESMKAAGVPAKGLLGLFGLALDDLVDLKRRRGVDVRDNDIVISPGQVLPPPEIRGRLTRVVLTGDRLVQTFGSSDRHARPLAPQGARNYVYFAKGTIRFGKLTMSDADLQLIDMDPRDPFEFDPPRYEAQLVAGYSKNTPQKGLRTFMPDIDDLQRAKKEAGQRGAIRGATRGGL
jgi:hypothetical protein